MTYGVAPAPPPRVLTCCAGGESERQTRFVCRVLCVGEEHNKYKYDAII